MELKKDREKRIAKVKARVKNGKYCTSNKITGDKVVEGVLKDIKKQ